MSKAEAPAMRLQEPYQIIIDADAGAVIEARELGSEECVDPARYALNEARSRKKAIICVVVGEDGFARSARSEATQKKDAPAAVATGASS